MTNTVVQTFLDLAKIDSPSGNEEAVAAYIINFLKNYGTESIKDKYGNVVSRIYGDGEPIVITGHMDTVEPGRNIKPVIEDGIIKSDGTTILGADNKAWLAAMLETLRLCSGQKGVRNVDLVFTRQEEEGNGGSSHLDLRLLRGKRGFSCDDGSPLGAIFVKSPFYIKIDISVIGKSAHSAEPEKASNALKAAAEAIHVLPLGDIGYKTIRNIGIMNSGQGRNTIPGQVNLVAEIRSFSKDYLNYATAEMINTFREITEKHKCTIRKKVELENPGFEVDLSDSTLSEAKMAMTTLGITPRLEETYGCFDANYFNGRGLHIINMSDGSVDSHTTLERIAICDLEKLQKLTETLMTVS